MCLSRAHGFAPRKAHSDPHTGGKRWYAQSAPGHYGIETKYRQGHRRQGRGDRAIADRHALQGPRADRGRARHR